MMSLAHDEFGATHAGPPVVLIHGFPLDRRVFAPVAQQLSAHLHVVNVDLLGFGRSKTDLATWSLEDQARAVHGLLKSKGLLPCVLGGLSMGGYIAFAFHRLFAADLRGLILVDTKSAADTAEGKEGRVKMAELARKEGAAAVAAQMLPKMLAEATHRQRPEIVRQLTEIMNACPAATIAAACLAMRDRPDYTPDLSKMTIPLLMITGAYDAIAPTEIGQAIAANATKGTYAEIPDAGHISTLEQPKAVASAIETFMKASVAKEGV